MTTITNPPAAALLERVRNIDPAALADANKQIRVVSSDLRPLQSGLQLLGRAYTVRCDGDFLEVIAALAEAAAGDVLVVDAQSSRLAMVGELFSLEAARRGLGGIVVDGAVRDVSVIRTLTMPVYARTITPVSGGVGALGARQVPVICGGVEVNPGDIVFGDDDGIIVASIAELSSLIDAAEAIKRTEQAVIAHIAEGRSLLSLTNYAEHYARVGAGDTATRLQFTI
jgi:RraA family protein